jgi:hypothetical protein
MFVCIAVSDQLVRIQWPQQVQVRILLDIV